MNETIAVIFISTSAPHDTVIAYEQADIDYYREVCSSSYKECGICEYDSYKNEIIKMM